MTSEDEKEIERINRKKSEELRARMARHSSPPPSTFEGKPIVLSDSTFSNVISQHPLMVVDFWAPWCGPCRMVSPVIEQLANEYAGKVAFGKLNVDENPVIASTFGVQSIPTILVFKDGKAVDGLLGAVPKSYIESKFKPYMDGRNTQRSMYS